jgi:hypothetical protein
MISDSKERQSATIAWDAPASLASTVTSGRACTLEMTQLDTTWEQNRPYTSQDHPRNQSHAESFPLLGKCQDGIVRMASIKKRISAALDDTADATNSGHI